LLFGRLPFGGDNAGRGTDNFRLESSYAMEQAGIWVVGALRMANWIGRGAADLGRIKVAFEVETTRSDLEVDPVAC
jgi:hypothetical protein